MGDLAARIRKRDPEALAIVTRTYLKQIHRAARGAGFDAPRAEDIVQETFKTFVEKAPDFEGRSHVRTWLFGILLRKIQEARRGLARDAEADPIDEIFESRFDADGKWLRPPRMPDARLETRELGRMIQGCLDEAPDKQRTAFLLREVEGLSTDEICNILDVTVTNLGVMLHRLRHRLQECLETKEVRP